ncbi:abortive infection protein [Herbiconiux sp. L3-i23]|nr:abortive infection protein [Herbiconiux sp. L3-i23]
MIALGLGIAYAAMWLPVATRMAGFELEITGPAASIVWNLIATGALLAYVLLVERRPLSSIRLVRPRGKDLEWALILFGCHMGWSWLARTLWPPSADPGTATITAMPEVQVIALILSAAVCEEILYRGYPIERLTELTGHRVIAVALTAPIFVAPHLIFFDPQWLLYNGTGTLAIYVLYLWRRNLVACMVLHLGINAPILIPTVAAALGR